MIMVAQNTLCVQPTTQAIELQSNIIYLQVALMPILHEDLQIEYIQPNHCLHNGDNKHESYHKSFLISLATAIELYHH